MKLFTHEIGHQTFDIIIGTNARENWEIIDDSDPFDLWFHVDEFPSGHVIIREHIDKIGKHGPEPFYPNEIINMAANYCKSQSKYRDRTKLKIVYTEISNLRKGKDVGSVIVSKGKYIFV